jgi:hypothetical protein
MENRVGGGGPFQLKYPLDTVVLLTTPGRITSLTFSGKNPELLKKTKVMDFT